MEKIVTRVDEYEGPVPRPKKLPGNSFMSVEGYPEARCNHFVIDFNASDIVVNDSMVFPTSVVCQYINTLTSSKALFLSDPEYVVEWKEMKSYLLFTASKEQVVIQVKYYNYFTRKYKGCYFMTTGRNEPVGVKFSDEIVGIVMPVMMSNILILS